MKQTPILHLFFSSSRADEAMLGEIEAGLTMLKREGSITIWDDRLISGGRQWQEEIHENLNKADIILILLSQNYLKSDYLYEVEMASALQLQKAENVRVIPILLSPCDWIRTPLSNFQVLPRNAKPVTEWRDHQAAFRDIVKNIQIVVEELLTGIVSERLITEKALLSTDFPNIMVQVDKEKELERIEKELEENIEKRVSIEFKKGTEVLGLSFPIVKGVTAISLSFNLLFLFEFIVYKIPWQWLLENPNSYSLQASFDTLLILLVVGILYPNWRKWCWGGGTFAVLLVVLQVLGGPR